MSVHEGGRKSAAEHESSPPVEASERKWRYVLTHIPQIGISLDPEGRITFANAYFLQLTGWTEAEILGRDWFTTCLPEEIRDDLRAFFRSAMEGNHPFDYSTYENPIITRSGERRQIGWSNVLTRDAQGRVVDVTCLGVDLTDRIRLETALREANERLELILEITSDGYWDYDLVTGETFVSPRLRDMAGLHGDSAPPTLEEWLEFIHPDEQDSVRRAFEDGLQSGKDIFRLEFRIRTASGDWLPVAVRYRVTRGSDGRAVRVTGAISDVSALKAAEAETARQLAELQQWYRVTLGREKRILELKAEVNDLLGRLGMPARYGSPGAREHAEEG